jgi:uncharacterized protein YkwD
MRFCLRRAPTTSLRRARGSLAGVVALLTAPVVHADPMAVINALRTKGCAGRPAVGAPVRPSTALNDAARELSRKSSLEQALEHSGYPATSSKSFHVRGSREDDAIRRLLASRYCAAVNDPKYEEVGVFGSGDETWIVLAVRRPPEPILEPVAVAWRVLELVNAARAEGRKCGADEYGPTGPVTLSPLLNDAASAHSRDMAARGTLSHRGSGGSLSGDRITRAGYAWQASGENVAAGQDDADAVVAAWLSSPGHCATLMGPYFTEMGVAFALAPSKDPGIYWTQVFAAPLNAPTE